MEEKEIVKFIQSHMEYSPEEMKKVLRKTFPEMKFRNEDVEKLIIKATSRRIDVKEKDEECER